MGNTFSGAGYLPNPDSKPIILASRASTLAKVQTNIVVDTLTSLHTSQDFTTSFMTTEGDKNQSQALYLLGGKSLWTKELEVALLNGEVDMLVHSLKDVPTVLPPGCELGAILEREDPSDCLVVKKGLPYKSLQELPDGSVVGTSSVRRVAQLKRAFPKLVFQSARGNLKTRLAKLDAPTGPYTALILAKAGLVRLDFDDRVTCAVTSPVLYHAVGQGALGVEIRSNDPWTRELAASLTHWRTEWMCRAERAMLRVLEGGCSVPVGVETSLVPLRGLGGKERERSMLTLCAAVTGLTGEQHVEHTYSVEIESAEEAEAAGEWVAKVLIDNGAAEILENIGKDRDAKNAQTQNKLEEGTIAST